MLKTKITKEDVNLMPVAVFEGRITVVEDSADVAHAFAELSKSEIVGIDTETKPSFTRGTRYKVSLVQISTLDHCYLFRLNKINFPLELATFLANKNIKKIGLSLRDDLTGLSKHISFKPENFVDIQTIVRDYGVLELGLQKIYAILFGRKISKSQRLTNWENPELTEQQQRYAATDAWASLQIYLQLMQEKKLSKKQVDKLLADDRELQLQKHLAKMAPEAQ